MTHNQYRWMLMLLLFGTAGCLNPGQTRYPSLGVSSPNAERREFEKHDPYPDRAAGPDMQSRPREYNLQRAEARRAVENRTLLGTPSASPSYVPQNAQQYPQSVPN